MCTLTVRGNSFHKQRHSCPHSFSPGFFHSLHSSSYSFYLFSFFFFYKRHCSVKYQGIAVNATKALRAHQSVSSPERKYWCYRSSVNQDKWSLGPGSLQAGRGGRSSAECTNTPPTTPHICKKHTIHHLTRSLRPRTLRGISVTQRSSTAAQVRSASPGLLSIRAEWKGAQPRHSSLLTFRDPPAGCAWNNCRGMKGSCLTCRPVFTRSLMSLYKVSFTLSASRYAIIRRAMFPLWVRHRWKSKRSVKSSLHLQCFRHFTCVRCCHFLHSPYVLC